jgi:hypothetical protein
MATKISEFRRDDLIDCFLVAKHCFGASNGSNAAIAQFLSQLAV